MGAPGSGKGTQAAAISERYRIPAISTGSMFRAAVASESPLGRQVKELLCNGALVPDDVTDQLVVERLASPDAAQGWLLDGYPRTLGQVSSMDACLADHEAELDCVLFIDVSPDELMARILLRGEQEGRADDNAETLIHRLEVYREQTEPVLAQYAERGVVVRVDGHGTVEEVAARVEAALDPLADAPACC